MRITIRMIPIILILILVFALGLTRSTSSAGTAINLLNDLGGNHKAQLEEAYSLYVSGDYNRAVALASDVLQTEPENPLAHHIIGLSHARRGLIEEAESSFRQATEFNPEFDLAWYDLGVVEESRGEFHRALEAYRKAAALDDGRKRYAGAVTRLEIIVMGEGGWEWREKEAERLFLDGVSAVNRGGIDDLIYAENIFRALVADRPYDVASRNMLGMALARQGRLNEAEDILIGVVEDEPGYSDAWYNLGMLHRAQGRLEEALADFETAHSSSSLKTFREITMNDANEIRELIESEINITPQPNPGEESDVPDE